MPVSFIFLTAPYLLFLVSTKAEGELCPYFIEYNVVLCTIQDCILSRICIMQGLLLVSKQIAVKHPFKCLIRRLRGGGNEWAWWEEIANQLWDCLGRRICPTLHYSYSIYVTIYIKPIIQSWKEILIITFPSWFFKIPLHFGNNLVNGCLYLHPLLGLIQRIYGRCCVEFLS